MTIIAAYYNEGKRVREIRLDEHVELKRESLSLDRGAHRRRTQRDPDDV